MLSEYKIENKYRIGGLKDFIYLIPNSANINYTVDNGEAVVHSISSPLTYKLPCHSITLMSEEVKDGRFKFNNTVSLSIYESSISGLTEVLNNLIHDKYKVIVEDKEGTQYICNVEFPAFITYNYQFSTNSTSPYFCTITFSTDSNFPTLEIQNRITNNIYMLLPNCNYNIGKIKELKLCNYNNTYIVRNDSVFSGVYATGAYEDSPYKTIQFIPNTFSFNEEFDGSTYTDTLTFSIPLNLYKSYWQYNLIEFKQNKYVALFETENGNVIASGYSNGYFPSYIITTSENAGTLNTITITLQHISEQGFAYNGSSNMDDLINKDVTIMYTNVAPFYQGTTYYVTTACISPTQSCYTLLQEITTTGVKLNNYWVLEGYENVFANSNLNIVGSYSLTSDLNGFNLIINDNNCSSFDSCSFVKVPSQLYTFDYNNLSYKVNLQSTCNWTINNIPPFLNVDITQGNANTDYIITLSVNNISAAQNGMFIIYSGEQTYIVNVSVSPLIEWRVEEGLFQCNGESSYEVLVKYVSTDNINWIKTDETRLGNIINSQDNRCESYEPIYDTERWVIESDEFYICEEDTTPPTPTEKTNILKYNGTTNSFVIVNDEEISLSGNSLSLQSYKPITSLSFYKMNTLNGLNYIDLSDVDTKNITSFNTMFGNYKGTSLNLDIDTSNVVSMARTFESADNITELDLSSWKTNKCTNMMNLFRNCSKLVSIDIRQFDMSKLTDYSYMFEGCYRLTNITCTQATKNFITLHGAQMLITPTIINWTIV